MDNTGQGGWAVYAAVIATGRVERISPMALGPAGSWSDAASLSPDGQRVAFLAEDPHSPQFDLYWHDRATGRTARLTAGAGGDGPGAEEASISADGTRVAFRSSATNLDGKDTNKVDDVFAVDDGTDRVS